MNGGTRLPKTQLENGGRWHCQSAGWRPGAFVSLQRTSLTYAHVQERPRNTWSRLNAFTRHQRKYGLSSYNGTCCRQTRPPHAFPSGFLTRLVSSSVEQFAAPTIALVALNPFRHQSSLMDTHIITFKTNISIQATCLYLSSLHLWVPSEILASPTHTACEHIYLESRILQH